jgi:hypothetical protein
MVDSYFGRETPQLPFALVLCVLISLLPPYYGRHGPQPKLRWVLSSALELVFARLQDFQVPGFDNLR